MSRKALLSASALLAGTLVFALAAPAQADVTDDLLRQLREKGILSQEEYNVLLQRKQAEAAQAVQAQPAAPSVSPAQAIDPDQFIRAADSGIGFTVGPVAVTLSGSINGFYVYDDPEGDNGAVAGGLAGGTEATSAIRSGLLPSFLKFDFTTTQGGIDIGAHFGLYPGINSSGTAVGANSGGLPIGLGTSGIDFRQNYLTFGTKAAGTVKIGRDIGLFGSDAILNDMTLLGVGTAAGNAAPANTSLGRIGLGYIYTDFQPQISYTSPRFGGFQVAVGVFQPLNAVNYSGLSATAAGSDSPGFQGEITYDLAAGGVTAHLWASAITQDQDGPAGEVSGTAVDVGAKLGFGGASVMGYYYTGEGIGSTGLFYDALSPAGQERDSDGYLVQAQYTLSKVTLGVSYGVSNLDLADGEAVSALVASNESWVFQGRYAFTDWLSLVGEYINTQSEAHNGASAENNTIALGGILFF